MGRANTVPGATGVSNWGSVITLTATEFLALTAAAAAGTLTPAFGERYLVSDGALAGRMFEWNGESFGGFYTMPVLQSFSPASRSSANVAGDATYAVLASLVLPGYLMRPSSKLRIVTDWAFTLSASTKTLQMKFGGVDVLAPSYSTPNQTHKVITEIENAASYTAQKTHNNVGYGASGNAHISSGIDTRSQVVIEIGARWGAAVASEVITLVGYSIELEP